MKQTSVDDCKIIQLSKHHRPQGNLTVVENGKDVPFDVKRVYYLYDVPGGATRGGHAHRELSQLLVAVSGCFSVMLDDGHNQRVFQLNRSNVGIYIAPGIWRVLDDFSSGSVCLVLASEKYDESDYIYDYDEFTTLAARCSR